MNDESIAIGSYDKGVITCFNRQSLLTTPHVSFYIISRKFAITYDNLILPNRLPIMANHFSTSSLAANTF